MFISVSSHVRGIDLQTVARRYVSKVRDDGIYNLVVAPSVRHCVNKVTCYGVEPYGLVTRMAEIRSDKSLKRHVD